MSVLKFLSTSQGQEVKEGNKSRSNLIPVPFYRVCGRPSNATIENLYPQLVAFIYVNTTASADQTASVELTWLSSSSEEATTTTTTTTTTGSTTTEGPAAQQLRMIDQSEELRALNNHFLSQVVTLVLNF